MLGLPLTYRNFDGIYDGTWWPHQLYTVDLQESDAKIGCLASRKSKAARRKYYKILKRLFEGKVQDMLKALML